MNYNEVMAALESYGDEQTKKTFKNHGALEPLFGVRVGDMKKILKRTKKNHELSLQLYATGNSDAMYLAGLMADEKKISKQELQNWVQKANWAFLSEYAVPWVAAETAFGYELGVEWIHSKDENIAAAGWATLSGFASVHEDIYLDLAGYESLLDHVSSHIHSSPNRVKYTMNNFVISVAAYIKSLTDQALVVADKIGKVSVDMHGTACKVPDARTYIQKRIDQGTIGKKRKTARC